MQRGPCYALVRYVRDTRTKQGVDMRHLAWYRLLIAVGFFAALGLASAVASQRTAASMASAAEAFLASLPADQRAAASFSFNSDDRERFHYIPTEMFLRHGLKIEDMNEEQRAAAHNLLSKGLSEVGYKTAVDVIELEGILGTFEASGRMERNPGWYYFSVFGNPSPRGTWGWRVEGHHLSLHFTVVNGETIASTPAFFGSNPAEVKEGPHKGMRVLGMEEDAARALLKALDDEQRAAAIIDDEPPSDIATEAFPAVHALGPGGVKAADLTPAQRALLTRLITTYTSLMADDLAAARMARLEEAGMDDILFAWAGGMERGDKHYYRLQGPTFLIEFDNTQNDGNHVHSVWRDFNGDFGRDILREHLRASLH